MENNRYNKDDSLYDPHKRKHSIDNESTSKNSISPYHLI